MSLHHRLRAVGVVGGSNTATVAYVTGTNNTTSGTSFTFNSHSIGTANANRRVVVVAYANGSSVTDISGVTIGGNAATLDKKITSISAGPLAIYSLPVASGTTATIVVSTTGTASRCRIEVYTVTGDISIPAKLDDGDGYTASGTSVNDTLTVAAGAAVVAGMGVNDTDANTLSWTNLTENSENNTGSTVRDMSVASTNVASGSSLSVTATSSASTALGMVAASYQ